MLLTYPKWIPENCIMCNQCSFVCPHAPCIRPFRNGRHWLKDAPETPFVDKRLPGAKTYPGLKYRMQLSPLDCTGCGNCADICPAKEKATRYDNRFPKSTKLEGRITGQLRNRYAPTGSSKVNKSYRQSDRSSLQPLFEFSGACAGCGETPYVKLITQLFGDRMNDLPTQQDARRSTAANTAEHVPVYERRERARPRLGELAVRGQR